MNKDATTTIRGDREALVAFLREHGSEAKGTSCRCIVHPDNNPSASIYHGADGAWRMKCHSCGFCGDLFDLKAKLSNRPLADVLKEANGTVNEPAGHNLKTYPTIEALTAAATWGGECQEINEYRHPETKRLDLVTFRIWDAETQRKSFRQGHQRVDGQFVLTAPAKPWPLFNRTRLKSSEFVIVVEGEKCVRALLGLGVIATTSPGGAGKAEYADWRPLAGKTCYLWPDADAPNEKTGKSIGVEHMRTVAGILRKLDCQVFMVDPFGIGLGDGGDVADLIAASSSVEAARDRIDDVLREAVDVSEACDAKQRIADCIAGRYATAEWPWPTLTTATQSLRPGTITLLCGDPGATKSLLMLESFLHWTHNGINAALYELEEDAAYWQMRLLAMLSECEGVTRPEWCRENADQATGIFRTHERTLQTLSRRMTVVGNDPLTYADLLAWIRDKANAGNRIIVIDPITAISAGRDQFIADLDFMSRAKAIIRDAGCSLVLVTHPKKSNKTKAPLDDMAAGAAFPRFAQTILWIHSHWPALNTQFVTCSGPMHGECNRSIQIAKARNGRGGGRSIGFDFTPDSLRFAERGMIVGNNE